MAQLILMHAVINVGTSLDKVLPETLVGSGKSSTLLSLSLVVQKLVNLVQETETSVRA